MVARSSTGGIGGGGDMTSATSGGGTTATSSAVTGNNANKILVTKQVKQQHLQISTNHMSNTTSKTKKSAAETLENATISAGGEIQINYKHLLRPPSQSMVLNAVLQLLPPYFESQHVYILPVSYLTNWLCWAHHQIMPRADETKRLQSAVVLACRKFRFDTSILHGMNYNPPGPVDVSSLSITTTTSTDATLETTATDLSNTNSMKNGSQQQRTQNKLKKMKLLRRRQWLHPYVHITDPMISIGDDKDALSPAASTNNRQYDARAVSQSFYTWLRSTHGIVCTDLQSISFQAPPALLAAASLASSTISIDEVSECCVLLHHHNDDDTTNTGTNDSADSENGSSSRAPSPRKQRTPLEFPRRVVRSIDADNPNSPFRRVRNAMEKLMREETPEPVEPELWPVKLSYTVATSASSSILASNKKNKRQQQTKNKKKATNSTSEEENDSDETSFLLVSRGDQLLQVLRDVVSVAAPDKAKGCVRIWSRHSYRYMGRTPATSNQEEPTYEVVDMYDSIIYAGTGDNSPAASHTNNNTATSPMDGAGAPSPVPKIIAATAPDLSTTGPTVLDWVRRHQPQQNINDTENSSPRLQDVMSNCSINSIGNQRQQGSYLNLDLLIETRDNRKEQWPLRSNEFSSRLKVGDFVDAQDVAGNWYEAVVRELIDVDVDDETIIKNGDEFSYGAVRVHFCGWASRWDYKIKRSSMGIPPPTVNGRLQPPAPLWSRTGRWREQIRVGDVIEVRDSSSLVERPKWYKGVVQRIGRTDDKVRDMSGGADIAHDEDDGTKPLLILHRNQQILVEVEQERNDPVNTSTKNMLAQQRPLSPILDENATFDTIEDAMKPEPPVIRWVYLYGEEVCKAGTHLKDTKPTGEPVTLRYEVDGTRKPVEVMKSHPMHGSGFMRESLRGTPPAPGSVGLHNLGNSCFLNSTVQCLTQIEPLTQFFLRDRYSQDLNKHNPLGSGGNVAVAYASLLKKMWAGQHSVLVPRLLKQTVAGFAPQFDNSYQHDSHEFCQFLMDGLHEDLNRVKSKPYVEELEGFGMQDEQAAIESWRKHLMRHDSIVVDHCQGMHRSHLTCPQCGRESIKFDVFSSISLPLPMDKHQTTIKLEDCIEKFMEAEQLDERDAYYCASCRRHVCALKLIALWSVPDILIVHMKRFTFDTCMTSGGMLRSKIDHTVEFPINGLDLTKEVLGPIDPDAPPIYNLFGVSEHSGPTATSGHYTATIRNSVDGQWYRCNDSHVGRTSGEAAITGGAYLLFYRRAKGSAKWGGMSKLFQDRKIDPFAVTKKKKVTAADKEGFHTVLKGSTATATSQKKRNPK